jgi:DNA-3-methyladenine glycosylase I
MADPIYLDYHDHEWGHPEHDDVRIFEKLCLEGFQAGLSWLTILRKREGFRRAFAGFDFRELARWPEDRIPGLLADPGIVRHPGKVASVFNNARRACELVEAEGSLAAFAWRHAPPPRPTRCDWPTLRALPTSPESLVLAKALKKRGWTFVGPTTVYAFMQALGLVDDHVAGCFVEARRPGGG